MTSVGLEISKDKAVSIFGTVEVFAYDMRKGKDWLINKVSELNKLNKNTILFINYDSRDSKELKSIEFNYSEIIKSVIGDKKYKFEDATSESYREPLMSTPITKIVIHITLL